jgi:hypothetical protein
MLAIETLQEVAEAEGFELLIEFHQFAVVEVGHADRRENQKDRLARGRRALREPCST